MTEEEIKKEVLKEVELNNFIVFNYFENLKIFQNHKFQRIIQIQYI